MKNLFQQSRNLFGFEHSYFIEVNGRRAGMVLGYTREQKRREELHTGLLLVKYLKWSLVTGILYLLKAQNVVGKVAENEYYISNLAVYPEFRGLGLGTMLLLEIEREARGTSNNKIVLDVETNNKGAIKLYEKLGYIIERESPRLKSDKKTFEFFRMCKILE